MKKFTDTLVSGLKPKPQRYFVREDAPRGEGGFGIRVMPTGAKSWQMIYTFEGKRKWLFLGEYPGMKLTQARAMFREKREILASGKDPGEVTRSKKQERRDSWTVNKLCDEFLEKYAKVKKRPRSAHEDELNLARDVRPAWGERKARDIRPSDVVTLLDEIVKRGAKVQANRTLATIRKMFAWALPREAAAFNPAVGVERPSEETPGERHLSLAEIKVIWSAMDKDEIAPVEIKKILKVLLLTGARPNEILGARWDQVDDGWLVRSAGEAKTKRVYRIYLSAPALKLLGKAGEGLIFTKAKGKPIPVNDLSRWVRLCNYFGIDEWEPRDLRRSCTSKLAEAGTLPHVVKRALNHTIPGITAKVYDRYTYAPEVKDAMDHWGKTVMDTVSGKNSKRKSSKNNGA